MYVYIYIYTMVCYIMLHCIILKDPDDAPYASMLLSRDICTLVPHAPTCPELAPASIKTEEPRAVVPNFPNSIL